MRPETRWSEGCCKCGTTADQLDWHHVEPKADGGSDDPENLVLLCAECHREWHRSGFHVRNFSTWLVAPPTEDLQTLAMFAFSERAAFAEFAQSMSPHALLWSMTTARRMRERKPEMTEEERARWFACWVAVERSWNDA